MWCRSPRAAARTGKTSSRAASAAIGRKGGRTPAEAGMHLIRVPKRPDKAPAIRITVGLKNAPDSWRDYFYWNMELDET